MKMSIAFPARTAYKAHIHIDSVLRKFENHGTRYR